MTRSFTDYWWTFWWIIKHGRRWQMSNDNQETLSGLWSPGKFVQNELRAVQQSLWNMESLNFTDFECFENHCLPLYTLSVRVRPRGSDGVQRITLNFFVRKLCACANSVYQVWNVSEPGFEATCTYISWVCKGHPNSYMWPDLENPPYGIFSENWVWYMVDKPYHRANPHSSFRPIARFTVELQRFVCDRATPPIIEKLRPEGVAMHAYVVSVHYALTGNQLNGHGRSRSIWT
jgi:hypothetical protein